MQKILPIRFVARRVGAWFVTLGRHVKMNDESIFVSKMIYSEVYFACMARCRKLLKRIA